MVRLRPVELGVVGILALCGGCANPCGTSGQTCTVLGTGAPGARPLETDALASPLYGPMDVAMRAGPDDFFVADWNNHNIKLVQDGVVSVVVGTEFLGDGDPDFLERVPPGVPGTEVALNHPTQLEWNPVTDQLVIPSWHNHRVRTWDPATGNSLVVSANTAIDDGNGANAGFAGDGGPAGEALMAFPNSIAIDPADGSFWLLAQRNLRIRKISADYDLIDTIAGTGELGYGGDGGDALAATFNFWSLDDLQPQPAGAIEYSPDGLLYIADTSNHVIRVLDLATGTIDTLPGAVPQAMPGGACDADALCYPRDLELDGDGQLWVADEGNHVIRRIDPATGEMTTVAGTFASGDGEDGLPALDTALNRPFGLDIDADGVLLIADTYNHRIRKVTP